MGVMDAPAPLEASHNLARFSCGKPSLDEWLQKRALSNQKSGATNTYVVIQNRQVIGYYSLAVASINRAEAPGRMRNNAPTSLPMMLLARLAVKTGYQGQGIGQGMLKDAIQRTVLVSQQAGVMGLLAHALDEKAKQFYTQYGFRESPMHPLTLILPIKDMN